jgi:hypothetical protein
MNCQLKKMYVYKWPAIYGIASELCAKNEGIFCLRGFVIGILCLILNEKKL